MKIIKKKTTIQELAPGDAFIVDDGDNIYMKVKGGAQFNTNAVELETGELCCFGSLKTVFGIDVCVVAASGNKALLANSQK